jgi:hypothetical protein
MRSHTVLGSFTVLVTALILWAVLSVALAGFASGSVPLKYTGDALGGIIIYDQKYHRTGGHSMTKTDALYAALKGYKQALTYLKEEVENASEAGVEVLIESRILNLDFSLGAAYNAAVPPRLPGGRFDPDQHDLRHLG